MGRSEIPICCDPNVMRLFTGGELYLSTYARRNWPPVLMMVIACVQERIYTVLALRESDGIKATL